MRLSLPPGGRHPSLHGDMSGSTMPTVNKNLTTPGQFRYELDMRILYLQRATLSPRWDGATQPRQRRIVPPTGRPALVPARASQSRIAPSLAAEKPRSISKLTTARGRCPLWMDHGWCWLSRRQGSCFSFVSPAQRDGPAPRAGSPGGGRPERNVCGRLGRLDASSSRTDWTTEF